jgi:hypothetical protein
MARYQRKAQVESPGIFRFDDENTELAGTFLGIRNVRTKFGPGHVADLELLDGGERVTVFLSAMLDQLLRSVKPGTPIEIVYTGTRETAGGEMKEFEVWTLDVSGGNANDEIPF